MSREQKTWRGGEKRARRRASILDAAVRLSEEGGFTLEELASEVGVSRVTLYRYFSSKEELEQALVEERGVEVPERLGVRERILAAAKELFLREGFGVTMEQIAELAGVGVATVYRHFGTKEELIEGFRRSFHPMVSFEQLKAPVGETPEQSLARMAAHILRAMYENRAVLAMVLRERMREDSALSSIRPGKTLRWLEEFFQKYVENGVLEGVPGELAVAFMGMLVSFSWLVPMIRGDVLEDPEKTGKMIARLFLHGAGHRANRGVQSDD